MNKSTKPKVPSDDILVVRIKFDVALIKLNSSTLISDSVSVDCRVSRDDLAGPVSRINHAKDRFEDITDLILQTLDIEFTGGSIGKCGSIIFTKKKRYPEMDDRIVIKEDSPGSRRIDSTPRPSDKK